MQGMFIFVLHVLRHEKVYGKIKSKLPNIRKRVSIVNCIIDYMYVRHQDLTHLSVYYNYVDTLFIVYCTIVNEDRSIEVKK